MGDVHGLLVTYRRPDDLRRTLEVVTNPSQGLASLTVVDNAPSTTARDLVRSVHDSAGDLALDYLPSDDNLGPAGGVALGTSTILRSAAEDDWVQVLDDDNPPPDESALASVHAFAEERRSAGCKLGVTGIAGARFNRWTGRLIRPSDAELDGPVTVDYVAGGQLFLTSVACLLSAGTFDRALFFGYDDLDYCLRATASGFAVVVDGGLWMAARERAGRTGPKPPSTGRSTSAWRRYYSVRNHITVLRRQGRPGAAVVASIGHLAARPVKDHLRGDSTAELGHLTRRGVADAWRGRLGRQVEPTPEATPSSPADDESA